MSIAYNNRITLIQFVQSGQKSNSAVSARYLSGILRSHGYKVTIASIELSKKQGSNLSWDFGYYDLSDNAIKNLFEISQGSLFVGFTVYSFVAHIVKKVYTSEFNNLEKTPFVVGGPHSTIDPYNSSFFSDYVCVGDGEKAIVELAQRLSQGGISTPSDFSLPVVENVFSSAALRQSNDRHIFYGKESPVDSQSFPDYSHESEYYISELYSERITKENVSKYIDTYTTFFSRGCVNNCSFCVHETLGKRSGFKKKVKSKELPHFVEELKTIRSNYPWVDGVVFYDSNILSNRRASLEALLNEYRSSVKLPLSVTGFTINQINEEIFRNFLTAGMNRVSFGIESGSEKTRELYNRRESKDQMLKIDELIQRLKRDFIFHVQYDVIVDSPWENPDDALESLLFISQLKGYDYLDIFSLRLLPGTKLFQKALDEDILKREDVDKENQRVYRSMDRTYENFLFLLMRDNFLRAGWLFRIAVWYRVVIIMRIFFRWCGKGIFRIYALRIVSEFVVFRRRMNTVWLLLRREGVKKTLNILKDTLWRKRP